MNKLISVYETAYEDFLSGGTQAVCIDQLAAAVAQEIFESGWASNWNKLQRRMSSDVHKVASNGDPGSPDGGFRTTEENLHRDLATLDHAIEIEVRRLRPAGFATPSSEHIEDQRFLDASQSKESTTRHTHLRQPRSLGDLLSSRPPEPVWLVEGLVAKGSITAIGGYSGAGKTPLILSMLGAVGSGNDFLGMQTARPSDYRIAYLTEESEYTFHHAAHRSGLTASSAMAFSNFDIYFWNEYHDVPFETMVESVSKRLSGNGLIIVDTILQWSQADDENDSATMIRALAPLQSAASSGLSVVAVAHTQKSIDTMRDEDVDLQQIRGSGAVVANSTVVALYKKPRAASLRSDTRFFKIARSRFGLPEKDSLYVQLQGDGQMVQRGVLATAAAAQETCEEKVIRAIESLAEEGHVPKFEDIRERSRVGKAPCKTAVERLVERGDLIRTGSGVRNDPVIYNLKV